VSAANFFGLLYVLAAPGKEITTMVIPIHLLVKFYGCSKLTLGPALKIGLTFSTLTRKDFD
jgi:hypothetical protein